MKVLLLILSGLAFSHQVSIERHLGINNGDEVAPYSIPYQVFIYIIPVHDPVRIHYCSGVLITSKHVLTSAHCISRISAASVYAGVRDPFNYRDDNGQLRNVNRTDGIIHEMFNPDTLENNIGIINLPEPFQLNERVAIESSWMTSREAFYVGDRGRISGWVSGFHQRPQILVATNRSTIGHEACNQIFGDLSSYEICLSGENKKRACDDDEGGPFVMGNIVEALISVRNVACNSTYPSVLTKIFPFINWIKSKTI